MTKKILAFQHLRASNCPNGNPQRLYAVYGSDGTIAALYDEGYAGLPKFLRDVVELPSMDISENEYHAYKREHKEVLL